MLSSPLAGPFTRAGLPPGGVRVEGSLHGPFCGERPPLPRAVSLVSFTNAPRKEQNKQRGDLEFFGGALSAGVRPGRRLDQDKHNLDSFLPFPFPVCHDLVL